jgi:DNA-binding NarL/FixJ family response regulator
MARCTHPDAVIMDVSMPRMGGIEATRLIVGELPHIRVIGLSMHEESDMAAAMRQAGAAAYVSKGGPPEALLAAIRAARPSKPGSPKVRKRSRKPPGQKRS